MSTNRFVRRSSVLIALVALCGFVLSASGCGKQDAPRQADEPAQQEMRKNKKND